MKKLVLLLVCVVVLFGGKIKNVSSVSKINMENAIERKFRSTEPAQLTLKIPIDVDSLPINKRLIGGISIVRQELHCLLTSSSNRFYQAVELNGGGKKTITMKFNGFTNDELFVSDGITYDCWICLYSSDNIPYPAPNLSYYLEEVNDEVIHGLFNVEH